MYLYHHFLHQSFLLSPKLEHRLVRSVMETPTPGFWESMKPFLTVSPDKPVYDLRYARVNLNGELPTINDLPSLELLMNSEDGMQVSGLDRDSKLLPLLASSTEAHNGVVVS
jgi:hypothetical protein